MTLQVFPYAFVRYTSLHQQEMNVFDPSDNMQLVLSNLRILHARKEESKTLLCEELFKQIQQATDDKKRQQLLNIKRAVFNDKLLNIPAGDVGLEKAISLHMQVLSAFHDIGDQWQQIFQDEMIRHRQALKTYAEQELLCKGILLSSHTLYTQLPSFISRDPSRFRHKELKTEYSLLKYLTRMAYKTSPFSTFTHTGIAVPEDGEIRSSLTLSDSIHAGIRLNNKLFDYLRLLMVHHPALNEILEIRLNPTIQDKGAYLQFLASYRNIESFQKMPTSDITSWLFSFLSSQERPVTLGTLTDTLSAYVPDADRSQVKSYLLQLVANGYIETGVGCSGIDPDWDQALITYLQDNEKSVAAINPLLRLLQLLRDQRQAYATATAAARGKIIQAAAAALEKTLVQLQEEAGLSGPTTTGDDLAHQVQQEARTQKEGFNVTRFMLQQFPSSGIFYEDTYTSSMSTYPSAEMHTLAEKADRLCTLLESLDTMQSERIRMRDFFLRHFDADQQISVTEFYYKYYQLEKKVQKEMSRSHVSVQEDTITTKLRQLLQLNDINDAGDVIRLTNPDFNISPVSTTTARGMFVQLFRQGEELYGVINNLLPGMGKVAGRFLDLFDPAVTASFREWNGNLYPDKMQLELSDGSSFNANIHPPLLSQAIRIPGSHSNYSVHQQTGVENVAVRYNPATSLLSLVYVPDGREIFAYDLSLQSFFNRSNFYQLLAHFNPEQRIPLRKLIEVTDEKYAAAFNITEADIICKPRITFEKHIILRRKAWVIKAHSIPQQESNETDAAYYLRLNKWHAESGIPDRVFLFLKSYAIPATKEEKSNMAKDDYKPQYISFIQPVMVNLFKKLLSRAGQYIYVEEMLPHVSHLQDTPVTEHLIHWYKY
ncbi:lantibiotic dehydratase [Chitinophaga sp. S165]|uniref:lantibiotic dehydratase n=1 Tax=Chitinophaga sp. S165 TaxID=2135462 RepID=UPI000D7097C6|nr:lantibiotic dehydratase [Chitinophaga sp. S165]PWV48832.1 lantibiotic biosynthesis dehydratase-like protein [Chitinophaga sp. S165]